MGVVCGCGCKVRGFDVDRGCECACRLWGFGVDRGCACILWGVCSVCVGVSVVCGGLVWVEGVGVLCGVCVVCVWV